MITLEEFVATGRNVKNLAQVLPNEDVKGPGRVYADSNLYIQSLGKEGWFLLIERSEYTSVNIAELEVLLYAFYAKEQRGTEQFLALVRQKLTVDDFVLTGTPCKDLGIPMDDEGLNGIVGRVYAEHYYIIRGADRRWSLVIGNQEHVSRNLSVLEGVLYQYYLDA